MSEINKTLTFFGVAAVACLAAFFIRPTVGDYDPGDEVGKPLFKAFDTEQARRMKITRFDEDAATLSSFEVAAQGASWSLPSKDDYPADAKEQLGKAVNGVRDKEILSLISSTAADHAQYGVIDPLSPNLDVGQTGVGARITIYDQSDDDLVDAIIGKEVKGSEGVHYVRRADQEFVYSVEVNPDEFSTKFEDWIEDDLLKISPWDIQQIRINDYSTQLGFTQTGQFRGVITHRSDLTLKYDDSESKWAPVALLKAADEQKGDFQPFELAEGQELDSDKLQDLKSALDDLKIVDVARKPEGLSGNLRTGDAFMEDEESVKSLFERGFAPGQIFLNLRPDEEASDLISSEGEFVCTMKDGVEYVLRFGDFELDAAAGDAKPGKQEGAGGEQAEKEGVSRYLFVMARFNESSIERPELEDVPELPAGAAGASEDEEATEGEASGAEEAPGEEAPGEEANVAEDESESTDATDGKSDMEKVLAERKAIERRNQQKLDDYQRKIEEGKKKVTELNERFGDWYYVISNDVFKKIHLGRDDIIKTKEPEEGEEAAGEASAAGAPGSPIPGLPNIPNLPTIGGAPANEGPTGEEPAEEPAPEVGEPENTEASAEATESPEGNEA